MRIVLACLLWVSAPAVGATLFQSLRSLLAGKVVRPTTMRPDDSVTRVCVYSGDPGRFEPKCFPCRREAYDAIALTGSDVSYTQASCIEKNCAIDDDPPKDGGHSRKTTWAGMDPPETEAPSVGNSSAPKP